jgi:hypothetical protein
MSFIEVEDIQSLQIGVWVKLEGSWFSHPFPTNTFTIKSAEDLATTAMIIWMFGMSQGIRKIMGRSLWEKRRIFKRRSR